MLNHATLRQRRRARANERGIVLLLTLIVLVAMCLAGASLARSTQTGNRVAGNLAFRQSATRSADVGVERAVAWLQANKSSSVLFGNLDPVGSQLGYFASHARSDEPAGSESWESYWDRVLAGTHRVNELPPDAAGNTVSFVIHRMCDAAGDPVLSASGCTVVPSSGSDSSHGSGRTGFSSSRQLYYRITVRVDGPRKTVSFVQAVVAV